jgi:hypothetical protein
MTKSMRLDLVVVKTCAANFIVLVKKDTRIWRGNNKLLL